MKAMILAAGLGTRLRPITESRPKALVEIGGRTLLQITLERLKESGVDEVIVNVHHFADMVVDYLAAKQNFGMRIAVSREDTLLDTGGGLKNAAWFFRDADGRDEPFVLYNVDVVSSLDISRMVQFHNLNRALATLAVQSRPSPSYLLFDQTQHLCGWRSDTAGRVEVARAVERPEALAFTGIHVISPRLLSMIRQKGVFSIIDTYLELAAGGSRIIAFRADEYAWRDVGSLESLRAADSTPRS